MKSSQHSIVKYVFKLHDEHFSNALHFKINRKGSLVTRTMRSHVAHVGCARLNSRSSVPP